jgi:hypothetical protein
MEKWAKVVVKSRFWLSSQASVEVTSDTRGVDCVEADSNRLRYQTEIRFAMVFSLAEIVTTMWSTTQIGSTT